ncbi:MAG TPA: hypothetical protein VGL72_16405 [Bryobacteraceae bacterium]
MAITVDGAALTAPHTFTCAAGSQHTVIVGSPQFLNGASNARYSFTGWSDGTSTTSRQITCLSGTATYTANFKTQYLLTTAVSPAGTGTVTANPSSFDGFYDNGTTVQLTASTSFSNWSGDLAGSANPQSVVMNGPRSVTASFTNPNSSFSIGTSPGGLVVTVDGTALPAPQTVTCTVGSQHTIAVGLLQFFSGISNTRYSFTGWGDGTSTASRQISCFYGSVSYTANFKAQYLLSTAVSPAGTGTVIANPSSPDGFYHNSTSVQLTASGDFLSWSGDLVGSTNPQSVHMIVPRSVTAFFGSSVAGLDFYPIPPCRVADTRPGDGFSGQFGPPSIA